MNIMPGYACTECGDASLELKGSKYVCTSCGVEDAELKDGITFFNHASDHEDMFEEQAVGRLPRLYEGFNRSEFLRSLDLVDFHEMDSPNKWVGITRKRWWESNLGVIRGKRVLEVGCGVNYLVPYWLETGNAVTAFDLCPPAVYFLKEHVQKAIGNLDNLNLAVADITKVNFAEKFDVISISNMLHHVHGLETVFPKLHDWLADDGKIILTEPNYWYPPRWITQTRCMEKFNFFRQYLLKNDLLEEDEKGIVIPEMNSFLRKAGLHVDSLEYDDNYLAYFVKLWVVKPGAVASALKGIDKVVAKWLPKRFAPFVYYILSKNL